MERETGATVIPLKYGYFDLLRFWCPLRICRNGPIERLRKEIEGIREQYKDARLVVFAHSYGTYALSRVLVENPYFKCYRIIMCGSIIRENFDWSRVGNQISAQNSRDAIINECGTRDFWPIIARSLTWGYGSSATFGFGSHYVRDRFHPLKHSDFFDIEFVHRYWIPAIDDKKIDFSTLDLEGKGTPSWFVILRLPLRWIIVLGIPTLLVVSVPFAQKLFSETPVDDYCGSGRITESEEKTGYDQRLYRVYYDFTRGVEKTDSHACGREVWISEINNEPIVKYVYLVNGKMARTSGILYIENSDGTLQKTSG